LLSNQLDTFTFVKYKSKLSYSIFCLIGVIVSFNVASVSAVIPSISRSLGKPEFAVAKIIWAYMIPYGICALFYGPLSRKFGIKSLLLFCLSLFSVFSFLSAIARTIESLFFYRLCVGIFASAMTPLALIFIAHKFKPQERGSQVGKFFSITFFASLLGLFLSGIINWRLIFLIPAVVSIFAVLMIIILAPPLEVEVDKGRSQYLQALRDQKIFRVFSYIFLISFLYHLVRQWLGVYFSLQFALMQFYISLLLTLESFAGIFGEFLGGLLADRNGRIITLRIGVLLMGISLILFAMVNKMWFWIIFMWCWGLGWTINHAGLSTYLTDMPKPYLEEVSSLNSSVRFLAGGLSTAVGNILMQRSFNLTFVGVGIILIFLFLFSNRILKV